MYYKKVLRLHFVNNLSGREIADSCGDCSKAAVNEFLKRFKQCQELSYPIKEDITNEYIESLLYKNSGLFIYGKLDGIRRRLTTGFTILIGKS